MDAWLAKLESGDVVGAWDAFLTRYRGVILATLRQYVGDPDDQMDVFADVCAVLRDDDLARLRGFAAERPRGARLSTWLVVVVRNRAIDFVRRRDGRRRTSAAVAALPPLRRRIAEYVFEQGCSHVEAYERLRTNEGEALTFRDFLAELSATYRSLDHTTGRRGLREALGPPWPMESPDGGDPAADTARLLGEALSALSPDVRAAVQLFVVDELPAAAVARSVGWPNAKAVYNRVYRALAELRAQFEDKGIRHGDL